MKPALQDRADRVRELVLAAQGIPLLAHAARSGNPDLVGALMARGAKSGIPSALQNAVAVDSYEVARTLVTTGRVDIQAVNFQGKTLLAGGGGEERCPNGDVAAIVR